MTFPLSSAMLSFVSALSGQLSEQGGPLMTGRTAGFGGLIPNLYMGSSFHASAQKTFYESLQPATDKTASVESQMVSSLQQTMATNQLNGKPDDKRPLTMEEALQAQHMGLFMGLISLYNTDEMGELGKKRCAKKLIFDAKDLKPEDVLALQTLTNQALPLPMPMQVPFVQQTQEAPQAHYTSLTVSKGLKTLLEEGFKTQKPVRVDLNDSASVILRLGRDGTVSAEFLTADKMAEWLFKQNLSQLKQQLEAKHLPVTHLSVRTQDESPDQQQQSKQEND